MKYGITKRSNGRYAIGIIYDETHWDTATTLSYVKKEFALKKAKEFYESIYNKTLECFGEFEYNRGTLKQVS